MLFDTREDQWINKWSKNQGIIEMLRRWVGKIFLVGKYAHAHATISHTYDWKNITSFILALNTLIITRKYINQREDKKPRNNIEMSRLWGYRNAREDERSGNDGVNRKSKLLLLIEAT